MQRELWTPQGAVQLGAAPLGYNKETGDVITRHTILVKATDAFGKIHQERIVVIADKDTSDAHVEDMMGQSVENFRNKVREKYSKPAPTVQQKKEIGQIIKQIREHRAKRKESTTGKIYF